MAFMKVDNLDPICPNCIKNTTIELVAGTPCTINIVLKLAPPPTGTTFPSTGETVTFAEIRYEDDDGNSTTKELGPPLGPAYGTWDSNSTISIQLPAASWLTSTDFANTGARIEIQTDDRRSVVMTWFGV